MILSLIPIIRVIACITVIRVFLRSIMYWRRSTLADLICRCWPLSQIGRYLCNLIISISTTWTLSPWTKAWWRDISLNNPCILLWSRNVCLLSSPMTAIPLILDTATTVGKTSAKLGIGVLLSVESLSTVATELVDIAILRWTGLVLSWVVMDGSWQSGFVCRVWSLSYRMSIVAWLVTAFWRCFIRSERFRWCFISGGCFRRSPIVVGLITTACASVPIRSRRILVIRHTCSLTWTLSCCRWLPSTTKVWICVVLIQTSFELLQFLSLRFDSTQQSTTCTWRSLMWFLLFLFDFTHLVLCIRRMSFDSFSTLSPLLS